MVTKFQNKLRIKPEMILLEMAPDGSFQGRAIVEVAEGSEVCCSANGGIQVEPGVCNPGSTTITLKAGAGFDGGILRFREKGRFIRQLNVTTQAAIRHGELPRQLLENSLTVPLPKQPETAVKYDSVVISDQDVISLHVIRHRGSKKSSLNGLIDVFNRNTWDWNRLTFELPPNATLSRRSPRPGSVCGYQAGSEVIFAFTGGLFSRKAVVYDTIRQGNQISFRVLRTPEKKRPRLPVTASQTVELAAGLHLSLPNLQLTSTIRTACLSTDKCVSDTSNDIEHLCLLLGQHVVTQSPRGCNSPETPAAGEQTGTLGDPYFLKLCEKLKSYGRSALPHIADTLRRSTDIVPPERRILLRLIALEMLAQTEDDYVLNDLLWAAYDQSAELRHAAARHLRRFPLSASLDIHLSLLRHIDPEIRRASAAALKSESGKNPKVFSALLENAVRFPDTREELVNAALT